MAETKDTDTSRSGLDEYSDGNGKKDWHQSSQLSNTACYC